MTQKEAVKVLRPVSREQVEKVWRSEWECFDGGCQCKHCGITVREDAPFCLGCGCAMWDEAVEMVMERLEAAFQ